MKHKCHQNTGMAHLVTNFFFVFLTVEMDLEINNEVGSATLPDKAKKISDSEYTELCSLMSALTTKVKETNVNTATTAFGLEGSFVQDGLGAEDTSEMVETWVDFEDDPLVKEAELEELIEEIVLEESGVGEECRSCKSQLDEVST